MLVGYKFCGGCNPYFDRGEVMQQLKERLSDVAQFENAQSETVYDAGVLIYGCGRRCLASGPIKTKYGEVGIEAEKDLEHAEKFLLDVSEKIKASL
jgi:hypothetical protein